MRNAKPLTEVDFDRIYHTVVGEIEHLKRHNTIHRDFEPWIVEIALDAVHGNSAYDWYMNTLE